MSPKYYPNLFKARYPILQGSDWIKKIDPDDRKVFVDIGLQANDHGKMGGLALLNKYGREYFSNLAKKRSKNHENS